MLCIQLPPQKNWEAVIFKLLHLIQNALGRGSHHEFQCHWVQTIELCNLMVTEYKHIICFLALCLQWMNVSSAELPHLHWSNFTSRMCVLQAFIIDLIGCGLWESELLVISKQYFFRVEPISWNLGLYANHWTWQVPVSISFSGCNRSLNKIQAQYQHCKLIFFNVVWCSHLGADWIQRGPSWFLSDSSTKERDINTQVWCTNTYSVATFSQLWGG